MSSSGLVRALCVANSGPVGFMHGQFRRRFCACAAPGLEALCVDNFELVGFIHGQCWPCMHCAWSSLGLHALCVDNSEPAGVAHGQFRACRPYERVCAERSNAQRAARLNTTQVRHQRAANSWAHGVAASHPLRMRRALGSYPKCVRCICLQCNAPGNGDTL